MIQLSVSLVEPYLKAWIALVVGLLPPAGFGVFFLIVFAIEMRHLRGGGFNGIPFWGAVAMIYVVLCIPATVVVLATRRRFLRLKRATQHTLAGIAWTALLCTLLGIISQMR